jgi:hypothetical protein
MLFAIYFAVFLWCLFFLFVQNLDMLGDLQELNLAENNIEKIGW